jgi:hypothetical protein
MNDTNAPDRLLTKSIDHLGSIHSIGSASIFEKLSGKSSFVESLRKNF